MDVLKKLNLTASEHQKKQQPKKDWSVGKQKDLEDFSRGASKSGALSFEQMGKNLKKAVGLDTE